MSTEDSMVFGACYETHVFVNDNGNLSIKQATPDYEDLIVEIPINHVDNLVNALRREKELAIKIAHDRSDN